MKGLYCLIFGSLLLAGCDGATFSDNRVQELAANDATLAQVGRNAQSANLPFLFGIDHSRLAERSGEVLDASQVAVYSNAAVNSQILQQNIRAGLDLPYRVQAFYYQGQPRVVYTSSEFLQARHGLSDSPAQQQFNQDLQQLIAGIAEVEPMTGTGLTLDYGIVELNSDLDFDSTVAALKSAILAEGDTVWFYDLDYQLQAQAQGITLPKAQLLVFGAPAPGATAMREYPSIGLDTFG